MCVCVCHVTVAPNLPAQHVKGSALCFRPVALGHSGSGSQGEQRNGSSVTIWSWLRHWHWQRGRRSHPQDRCQGRGQASRFLSPRMVSHDPTTLSSRLSLPRSRRFRALYPAHQGLCWCQGRNVLGHFCLECPLMKVSQAFCANKLPRARRDTFQCKGGLHQAIVDSSCTQTLVQQTLVESGVLLEEGWVENRCVHGDIYKYPIASLRLPLVIHSMGFFPLEQFRDDTLRPAFDQVNNWWSYGGP